MHLSVLEVQPRGSTGGLVLMLPSWWHKGIHHFPSSSADLLRKVPLYSESFLFDTCNKYDSSPSANLCHEFDPNDRSHS